MTHLRKFLPIFSNDILMWFNDCEHSGAYLRQQSLWLEIYECTNQQDEQSLWSGGLAQKCAGDSDGYHYRFHCFLPESQHYPQRIFWRKNSHLVSSFKRLHLFLYMKGRSVLSVDSQIKANVNVRIGPAHTEFGDEQQTRNTILSLWSEPVVLGITSTYTKWRLVVVRSGRSKNLISINSLTIKILGLSNILYHKVRLMA